MSGSRGWTCARAAGARDRGKSNIESKGRVGVWVTTVITGVAGVVGRSSSCGKGSWCRSGGESTTTNCSTEEIIFPLVMKNNDV